MEYRSRGTLLTIIFLILGAILIPEPCDAQPSEYVLRNKRSADPAMRCPNCPRDCPEHLSGGPIPQVGNRIPPLPKQQYQPGPPLAQYDIPQRPVSYNPPPVPPQLSYNRPPYPPPQRYNYAQIPRQPQYSPIPPPPRHPPQSYIPARFPPPPPYNLPPHPPPQPPQQLPIDPPSQSQQQILESESSQSESSYDSATPSPSCDEASEASTSSSSATQDESESSYDSQTSELKDQINFAKYQRPKFMKKPFGKIHQPPVPPPRYLPPAPPQQQQQQPPYNQWSQPDQNFRNFNYNPYNSAAPAYSRLYQPVEGSSTNTGCGCGASSCGCGNTFQGEDLEEDDDVTFSKYNRRSLDLDEAPRIIRHYNYQPYADTGSQPRNMYGTYRPYETDGNPSEYTDDSGETQRPGRERLYVVYRADAISNPNNPTSPIKPPEEQAMSDMELESVIRKAIELARQQRAQENALFGRTQNRYHYENGPDLNEDIDEDEAIDFRSLNQQPYEPQQQQQQPQQQKRGYEQPIIIPSRSNLSPGQIMDNEDQFVIREDGDEAKNVGWDQRKWIPLPATPNTEYDLEKEFANIEIVPQVPVATTTEKNAIKSTVKGESHTMKIGAQLEKGDNTIVEKKDVEAVKATEAEVDTKGVDLIEEMEAPQIVTETSNFEKLPETTSIEKT